MEVSDNQLQFIKLNLTLKEIKYVEIIKRNCQRIY